MYAARKGSPLAFGKKGDNFFIASDASPIIEHTKKIIYLENEHLLKINNQGTSIIMTTHNYTLMDKYKKDIYICENGKFFKKN